MIPMSPFDVDNVLVALITGLISFAVAFITSRTQAKSNEQNADKTRAETESLLRQQLEDTDKRLNSLSHAVSDEMRQRCQAEANLYDAEQQLSSSIAYVRALGHWLNAMCKMLDKDWLDEHPKPRLPDEIRSGVERTASELGLNIDKFDIQE